MTFTFDQRGEAAIARLRLNPDFNEELYRKLGPVQYWTHVNARKAQGVPSNPHNIPACEYRCQAIMPNPEQRCVELRGHGPVVDPYGRTWDHRGFVNGNASFWRATPPKKEDAVQPEKKHDKSSIIATRIVLVGGALCVTAFVCTIVGVICVTLWRVVVG